MEYPLLVILGVLAIGALFVVLPVVLTTLSEHRGPRTVVCPSTGGDATIVIDAGRAARGAIFGRSLLSVVKCSRWPEKEGCARSCLAEVRRPQPTFRA